ncbi:MULTISPECIES: hypothetical protein [Bradyrhizobium]|nr:hypothetical protein [Bradyrhizobium vignae]MBP0115316.1 hypothetical protein [Bradyrhizobium vignae]
MPKKPETPSSRLAHWKKVSQTPFPFRRDYSNQADWLAAAQDALDLESPFISSWDRSPRGAFKAFNLDPRDPFSWRILLGYYTQSHIGRGRPAKWDGESLCNLLRHISKARQNKPSAKQSEIYQSLIKRKAPYHGKTESYLKHGHRLALDLDRNDILRARRDLVAQGYLEAVRVGYVERGSELTASDERRIKNSTLVLDEALELIGAPNSRWAKKNR